MCLYSRSHVHISVHQYIVKCSVSTKTKNNSVYVNTSATKNLVIKEETMWAIILSFTSDTTTRVSVCSR